MTRVAVVGAGVVTPFGIGVPALATGAAAGRCAIGPVRRFPVLDGVPALSACLPDDVWRRACDERGGRLCEWALEQALTEATCRLPGGPGALRERGRGVVLFANHLDCDAYDEAVRAGGRLQPEHLGPWSLDRWARWLAERTGAAAAIGLLTACTASATAVGLGARWIRSGAADWAVVGGMELVHPELLLELDALRMLSATGCRPFAADHDGTVLGDGAALLLLERWDAAGWPLGEVLGYGEASAPARSRLAPDAGALAGAVRAALADAGLEPAAIGHVAAAATGSPEVDDAEAEMLRAVFGTPPPVAAVRAQIGHCIGGTCAVQVALGLASGSGAPALVEAVSMTGQCCALAYRAAAP